MTIARADAAWSIQTPSKNIKCGVLASGKIECLVFHQTFRRRHQPCDGVYAGYGIVGRRGRASFGAGCVSGLPFNFNAADARTLNYSESTTHKGVTCSSTTRGMRCHNRSDHGFFLSRRKGYRF